MNWKGVLAVVVIVMLVIAAPVFVANFLESFFGGVGTILGRWTD